MTNKPSTREKILSLREEKDAVILAHNYQIPEIQDIADIVGDSLELAKAAASLDCSTIVFCGVDFMAETATILAPGKTVLLPARDAFCPMAEMVTAGEIAVLKKEYPDIAVVAYVNTTADVKAVSDICCTSANAIQVVNSLSESQVLFVPDQNLARYVSRFTQKRIIPFEGFCIVHDRFTRDDVMIKRSLYPDARILVHPECRPEVIDDADYVSSTSGIIRYVRDNPGEYIIGTEIGILHQIQKTCPGTVCHPLSDTAICTNMKKTTLLHVLSALEQMEPRVEVPPDIAVPARQAIQRMIELS